MDKPGSSDSQTAATCPDGTPCRLAAELQRLRDEVARLSDLARMDELTGLYNFRYFSQALELEMERTRRTGQALVLIMLDLDNFKQVNDIHGHEFGNRVLEHVGLLIRGAVRRLDIPCRYGGEEFAVILPGTPLPAGILLARRLRRLIEKSLFETESGPVALTASLGLDSFVQGSSEDPAGFIQAADDYLRQAKQAGKNQVCHGPARAPESGLDADEREALQALGRTL